MSFRVGHCHWEPPEVNNTADIHQNPLDYSPLKEIWESPRAKENLTSVGFEPTISGLDPMLYRLSYESSTGAAGRGYLGSESW